MKKGACLKFQWPSTPNIVSISTTELIAAKLVNNPSVTISEKLDGSNVCVSSRGWVASRRNIIVEDIYRDDLAKVKLVGSNLASLSEMKGKVEAIQNELECQIKGYQFQTLIYGEWLQHRTSVTQEDRYCYKDRGFESGRLYAFGLSVIFDRNLEETELIKIGDDLSIVTGNSVIDRSESKIITYGLSLELQKLFQKHDIATAPVITKCSLDTALTDQRLVKQMLDRSIEGFILVGNGFILKWKPVESQDKSYQLLAISALRASFKDENPLINNMVDSLEKVCLSISERNAEPKKKPDKRLYVKLFQSAETKFQRIEDLLCTSMTTKEREEVLIKCRSDLRQEVKTDFISLGYGMTDCYGQEIDLLVETILRKRMDNWFKRLNKKKR